MGEMTNSSGSTESGEIQSRLAADAARRGDAEGMLRGLFAGSLVDWLFWRVSKQYARMPSQDVEDCVAESIGDAYKALLSGSRIGALPGYLLKAASNKAVDMLRERRGESAVDMDSLANVRDPTVETLREETRKKLRQEALAKARELLPQLGMDNIRKIMEVIFDAVEKEVTDLQDADIAEVVGLTGETVRRLKNRGFERLRRLANDKGYDLAKYERAIGITETIDIDDEGGEGNE